jgi:hypothetical protein
MRKDCISGSEAKRPRLNLLPPQSGQQELEKAASDNEGAKRAPPRLLREPAKRGDVRLAPNSKASRSASGATN